MKFSDLRETAQASGAKVKDCGGGHWQVIGDYLVNFYPRSRRGPTYYIAGTGKGQRFTGGIVALVELAFEPAVQNPTVQRKKRYGNQKRRLLRERAACSWCGALLTLETARLDHIIPLSKDGSNGYDNLCLACAPCDEKKGNKMPHEFKKDQAAAAPPPGVGKNDAIEVVQVTPPQLPTTGTPAAAAQAPAAEQTQAAEAPAPPGAVQPQFTSEFHVIGFWAESRQCVHHIVQAVDWETAICSTRDELEDLDHCGITIVDVLLTTPEGIKSVTGQETLIDEPVGALGVAKQLVDDLRERFGVDELDVAHTEVVERAKRALHELGQFTSTLETPVRLRRLWSQFSAMAAAARGVS
jgi:hypothetical protein